MRRRAASQPLGSLRSRLPRTHWLRFFKPARPPDLASFRKTAVRPPGPTLQNPDHEGAALSHAPLRSNHLRQLGLFLQNTRRPQNWVRIFALTNAPRTHWLRFFKAARPPKLASLRKITKFPTLVPQKTPFLRLLPGSAGRNAPSVAEFRACLLLLPSFKALRKVPRSPYFPAVQSQPAARGAHSAPGFAPGELPRPAVQSIAQARSRPYRGCGPPRHERTV